MEPVGSVIARSNRKTVSSEATNDAMVTRVEAGFWTMNLVGSVFVGTGEVEGSRSGPAMPRWVVATGRGGQAGEGEGEEEAGPKDEEEEGEVGREEGERTRWQLLSPSSLQLVKISSFHCGSVMGGHDNRNGGVARRDGNDNAVGRDSRARSVRGGSVGARSQRGIAGAARPMQGAGGEH